MLFPVRLHRLSISLLGGALLLLLLPLPAAAAPVFTTASATPDAVSPNLPVPDGVQDFTVVSYTVAVDSADIRVSLSTPGGTLVGLLQPFRRQGMGVHTVVFDGTIGGADVADGDYRVNVLGIDTGGAGSEQVDLPLLIDRAAPQVTVWELVSPASPVLQDGTTITLHACVTGAPDTVFVDLSALDSTFDPSQVSESAAPPDCRLYTYTISAANTVADTLGPVALATARDRAGNRTVASLDLCLSNNPPVILEATLQNTTPFFQNGDEIQARIMVSSPNRITAGGDFLNLDSGFNPGSVQFTDLGSQTFEVRYQITDTNSRDDGDYVLRLFARDQGCGEAVDSSLVITLDNAGQFSSLLDDVSLDAVAFSPTGSGRHQVHVNFTVLQDSLSVIIGTVAMLKNPDAIIDIAITPFVEYDQGTYSVAWNGASYPAQGIPAARLKDQQLEVYIRAVSFSQGQQRTYFMPLEIDNVDPILRKWPSEPGEVVVRNGQVLNIPLEYDRPRYTITADFDSVDSRFNPLVNAPAVADSGNGRYGVFYSVSPLNTVPDSTGVIVPVTAVDLAGNNITSELVRVCINNNPPRLLSHRFVGDSGPFRSGDRIVLETTWATDIAESTIVVTADFSAVDDKFDTSKPVNGILRAPGVYETGWTLSAGNGIKESAHLPIFLTAADAPDAGCGKTTVAAAYVDIDSNKPPKPTLSAPAAVTGISTTLLSGKALLAYDVIIERNGEPVDTFVVDLTDSTFLGTVTLEPGNNEFTARARDLAGNLSDLSDPVNVFFTVKSTLIIPGRFGPGNEFFLALLDAAGLVRVRIFNLEGIEIRRLESPGGTRIRVPWDGQDETGNLASSGPYLAVVEIEDTQGSIREHLRSAFVFTRRRAGQ
jgi:hypothetical protein